MRSALVVVVLTAVLVGCKRETDTPTDPSPSNEVTYSAVGASDGIGFGGSVPCLPFDPDCPNGTGYVYLLKRRLIADGRMVTLVNRALPGAVLSNTILTLSRDIGRNDIPGTFIDQVVPFISTSSTVVTIFAGGNDTNVIAQNIRAGRASPDARSFIGAQVQQWGVDFEELIRRIRGRAPNARIVAINLPNLGAAPYVANLPTTDRSLVQAIAVGLTDRINAARSQNVLVVDLMCEPRVYESGSFSSDGFHPSDRGYQLIADIAYPAVANGTFSTPSASCAQRALLPVF